MFLPGMLREFQCLVQYILSNLNSHCKSCGNELVILLTARPRMMIPVACPCPKCFTHIQFLEYL